jgi:hypothetical protein
VGASYSRGGSQTWGYFPQSDQRAAEFFAKGCALGDPKGCGDLGHALLGGTGVAKDPARAARLVVWACEKGYAFSCWDAGVVLYDGTGVEQDHERAKRVLVAGCSRGNPGACDLQKHLFGAQTVSTSDPPVGAVGVVFGESLSGVRSRCVAAGHVWGGDAERGYCNGPISKTAPFPFGATAIDGRVCSIDVRDPLGSELESSWLGHYDAVEGQLIAKYGTPYERVRTLPQTCNAVGAFAQCIASRRVIFRAAWVWERKFGVQLMLTYDKHGPYVDIFYANPNGMSPGSNGL